MLIFSVGTESLIEADAGFEILFSKSGGLKRAGLYGNAKLLSIPGEESIFQIVDKVRSDAKAADEFLSETTGMQVSYVQKSIKSYPTDQKGSIRANLGIELDFENGVFHGELNTYVNVAGGIIRGVGENGRVGTGIAHFEKNKWYVLLGTPDKRWGVEVGVGDFRVRADSYFMMGDDLPGSPPPPQQVASILGLSRGALDYMRDENALSSGKGVAFGQSLSINTGELRFLIFYASFQAGAGFDIMLKDYGNAQCVNTSSNTIGIDGWYANGQAYAYLQGELGVRVKLLFIKGKFPILSGSAAVLLQAKLPNPFWMRGYLGGRYNIMGGLIKGKYRFKVTIGKECEFANPSPLGGIKMIASLSPDDNKKDMGVFTAPQITFSTRIDEPMIIQNDVGEQTYKVILDELSLTSGGELINGKIEWSNSKDYLTYYPEDILPPNSEVNLSVSVKFQKKVGGAWQTITTDGKEAKETETRTFFTSDAPKVIPVQNIDYAYPVLDQKYFLEDESTQGYIQLKIGQDYLFESEAWQSEILLDNGFGKTSSAVLNYDKAKNRLTYTFPDLDQQTKYSLKIVSKPKNEALVAKEEEYKSQELDEDNLVEIRQNKAKNVSSGDSFDRLSYSFETSEYKTFAKKINSIRTTDYNWGKIYSDAVFLTNQIADHEPFDLPELEGTKTTANKPLVLVEAVLDDAYFKEEINPILYQPYPFDGITIDDRDTETYGIPPKKAVPVKSYYLNFVSYNVNQNQTRTAFPYYYLLSKVYRDDWRDLTNQIVNQIASGSPIKPEAKRLIDSIFPSMKKENYNINMQYILPGGMTGSSAIYKFKNTLR